jgi:hypothetical protein
MKSFKQFILEEKDEESAIEAAFAKRTNDPDYQYDWMQELKDAKKAEAAAAENTEQPPAGELDPVGKETPDVNNDGKLDSGDIAILAKRNAIAKAIANRK